MSAFIMSGTADKPTTPTVRSRGPMKMFPALPTISFSDGPDNTKKSSPPQSPRRYIKTHILWNKHENIMCFDWIFMLCQHFLNFSFFDKKSTSVIFVKNENFQKLWKIMIFDHIFWVWLKKLAGYTHQMSWDFPEISLDMFFKLHFREIFISERNPDWNCFSMQSLRVR